MCLYRGFNHRAKQLISIFSHSNSCVLDYICIYVYLYMWIVMLFVGLSWLLMMEVLVAVAGGAIMAETGVETTL
ncbi:hypothetical protein DCAR_0205664 [Daucus carota subsp. sativus]|uniref:Uncharacterized protein n=1 Tax=Daucus carota subsp. sativus TaxID=79200 RepID=A0A161WZS2_DAUCS|nr:hypothetical protein DCAR_0205664 [Daucus carota subsp. sativus]